MPSEKITAVCGSPLTASDRSSPRMNPTTTKTRTITVVRPANVRHVRNGRRNRFRIAYSHGSSRKKRVKGRVSRVERLRSACQGDRQRASPDKALQERLLWLPVLDSFFSTLSTKTTCAACAGSDRGSSRSGSNSAHSSDDDTQRFGRLSERKHRPAAGRAHRDSRRLRRSSQRPNHHRSPDRMSAKNCGDLAGGRRAHTRLRRGGSNPESHETEQQSRLRTIPVSSTHRDTNRHHTTSGRQRWPQSVPGKPSGNTSSCPFC